MTHEDVVTLLKRKQKGQSLRAFARQLDVSAGYLSDVMKGFRPASDAILKHLGLVKKVTRKVEYSRRKSVQN